MNESLNEIAKVFETIGSPVRLGILLVLYSSYYLHQNKHSLTFSELKEIMQISNDAVLEYHLKKLIEAGLITKEASQQTPSGRFIAIYNVTEKWVNFLKESGLAEYLNEFIKEKLGKQT
jgi:predicted ArsR family transcriptional regulator